MPFSDQAARSEADSVTTVAFPFCSGTKLYMLKCIATSEPARWSLHRPWLKNSGILENPGIYLVLIGLIRTVRTLFYKARRLPLYHHRVHKEKKKIIIHSKKPPQISWFIMSRTIKLLLRCCYHSNLYSELLLKGVIHQLLPCSNAAHPELWPPCEGQCPLKPSNINIWSHYMFYDEAYYCCSFSGQQTSTLRLVHWWPRLPVASALCWIFHILIQVLPALKWDCPPTQRLGTSKKTNFCPQPPWDEYLRPRSR